MLGFIAEWRKMVDREVGRAGGGNVKVAVDSIGEEMARMRGRAPVPHRARMSLEERKRAYSYMGAHMIGDPVEVGRRAADVSALERLLGMRSGKDGGIAPELGLRDEEGEPVRFSLPAQGQRAVGTASESELELVRRTVALLPLLPVALKIKPTPKTVDLLEVVQHVLADPPAEALSLVAVTLLASLREKEAAEMEIRAHMNALDPGRMRAELAKLSEAEIEL